jgi:uncharacterized protein YjbI with pentapeptide repeats
VKTVKVNGYTIEPGANLNGANLKGADLTEADLTRATANEDTIWPEGFDPVVAGVIFD